MTNEKKLGLQAVALASDPRVRQAKELLLEALEEHKLQLTDVRGPNPSLQADFHDLMENFVKHRGYKLFFPYIGSGIGNGPLVELQDGSVKYDLICGIGCYYFGHSHPMIVSESIEAALSNTITEGHLQQNVDAAELTSLLIETSKLDHCFLSSTGVMAVENGLKIIFKKKKPAQRVLAFERCFTGRTWACSQITDKPAFREGLPSNVFVDYVPFFNSLEPEKSTQEALKTLKKHLARHPNEYAAMIFELVQGEGGVNVGSKEFFISLMQVLKENNVAVLVDEVQTFGRTQELFAYQYFQLQEYVDVVAIGKLAQVCATLFTQEYNPGPGLLGQTVSSSTVAIRTGKVLIQKLLQDNYFGDNGKIALLHQHFMQHLQAIAKRHPTLLKNPSGIGTMIAFVPLDGEKATVEKYIFDLFNAGVITFQAGEKPTRVRCLLPVGALTLEDIPKVCAIIEETLIKRD